MFAIELQNIVLKCCGEKKHPHSGVTPGMNASLSLHDHHHVHVMKALLRDLIKSDIFSFSITVRNFKTTL